MIVKIISQICKWLKKKCQKKSEEQEKEEKKINFAAAADLENSGMI
jgi:hypothetical protein